MASMTSRDECIDMINRIPTGSENPLKVPNRETVFRHLVAEMNKNGDCIINVGDGYFRPKPFVDDEAVEHYLARELHRAREILYKRMQIKETYNRRRVECLLKAGTK